MSQTAEAEPQPSARVRLVNYLKEHYASVPDDASAQQLRKLAQPWGGDDPIIQHLVRQTEAEEQSAHAQHHDQQQQQIAQRIDQQTAEAAQQQLDIWWDSKLALAIGIDDETPRHPSIIALIDAIGEVNAIRDEAVRKKIEAAKKYTDEMVRAFTKEIMARFSDLETPIRTHFQCRVLLCD